VLDFHLNIMGSEWIIIIFVALIVLLGTNRLPEVTKKIGKVVGEYNKAKNDVQSQFKDFTNSNLDVSGPVKDERQKLETIAKSLGIDSSKKSDEQLRELISSKIGKPTQETTEKKLVAKELELTKHWNNIMNVMLHSANLPNKQEIDEVYKDVHTLRKRIAKLESEARKKTKSKKGTDDGNIW